MSRNNPQYNPQYNPNQSGSVIHIATGIGPGFLTSTHPDRLTTVDAQENVIINQTSIINSTVPNGGLNNEPHHGGYISNGETYAFGGLLSVTGNPRHSDIFNFNVMDKRNPIYIPSEDKIFATLPDGGYKGPISSLWTDYPNKYFDCSVTDEFYPIEGSHFPKGTYLVTMMGGTNAGSPGTLAMYDIDNKLIGTYPNRDGMNQIPAISDPLGSDLSTFNPHGVWYDDVFDLLMTSDYVKPISLIVGPTISWCFTLRIWEKFSVNRCITKTITLNDPSLEGLMSVSLLTGRPKPMAITCSVGHIYTIDPSLPAAEAATLTLLMPVKLSGYFTKSNDSKYITNPLVNNLVLINVEDPYHPWISDVVSIKKYNNGDYQSRRPIGCHYSKYTSDERFVYSSDYFITVPLLEDMGDKFVWRAQVINGQIINDPTFQIDFLRYSLKEDPNTIVEGRPHAIGVSFENTIIPFDDIPKIPIRSGQQLCNPNTKKIKKNLQDSLLWWLSNASSLMQLAIDVIPNPVTQQINFTESFDSVLNSCNEIGTSYDILLGKETAADIIRQIFLFSTEVIQIMHGTAIGSNITKNKASWVVRAENLASLLSNTIYLNYEHIYCLIKNYQRNIMRWIDYINHNRYSYTVYNGVLVAALKIGEYINKSLLELRDNMCHTCDYNLLVSKFKPLCWYEYSLALSSVRKGYTGYKNFIPFTIKCIVKSSKCCASKLKNLLKTSSNSLFKESVFKRTSHQIAKYLCKCYNIDDQLSFTALMCIIDHDTTTGNMIPSSEIVDECAIMLTKLFL